MRRCLSFGCAVVLIMVVFASAALARDHQPYILARISLQTPETAARLQAWHLDVVRMEKGRWVEVVTGADQVSRLRQAGFQIEVLIEDMEEHYARGRKGENFGDFHTYSETIDALDAIHAAYPAITTARDSIGTTHEGRALWAIKVSDNPDLQESEPEVLFDALHHAREPITVEVLLNTMEYLCANYGTDPEITFLVDNRQIWFVPVVNPDGYVYNEEIAPQGGGMWRKNRRIVSGDTLGVDLNRNYPYEWDGPGSSTNPYDADYRGPSPASEPETQGMIAFIEDHQFVTHNSYHSVAAMVLYPWGYTTANSPDDALFQSVSAVMAADNGYATGQPGELLYTVNGGMFDWTYGDTTNKPKMISFTTEVDGSGFWPLDSEIPGLVAENLDSDLYLIQIAGAYPAYAGHTITELKGPGQVDPGESVEMTVTLENSSPVAGAQGVDAVLSTDDAYVQLIDAQSAFGDIPAGTSADNSADPFAFSVEPGCPQGHRIDFDLEISYDGGALVLTESFQVLVGQPTYLYANDFESSSDWDTVGTTSSTGAFERIDPNGTDYQPEDDATPDPGVYAWITAQNTTLGQDDVDNGVSVTRSPVIDLSGTAGAHLSMKYFHGQRDQGDDPSGDFFRIDVSNDGGSSYPVSLVSFGDVNTTAAWRSLEVDLESVIALTDQIRLRVQAADGTYTGDIVEGGIDEIFITGGTGNTPPPAPNLSLPAGGDTVGTSSPSLVIDNVTDPDGDPVTYGFRVYGDELLTDLVATADGVAGGSGTTAWTISPPLLSEGTYWWRAYAADTTEWGSFSAPRSFQYVSSGPPAPAGLRAQTAGEGVALLWSPVAEAVGYVVYRDSIAGFTPGPEDSLAFSADTVYTDQDAVVHGYYVVRTMDAGGQKSEDSAQVGQFEKALANGE